MKKTKLFLCAVSLAFAGIAANAQPVYSGASLPTEQGWNELRLDNSVSSFAAAVSGTVADGKLKLVSNNAANQFSQLLWYKTNLGLTLGTGYTIEIKAKINAATKTSAFNLQGFDNEGKGFRIGILKEYLTNLSDPLSKTNTVAAGLTNGDGFHIFTFAFAPSGVVTVYRDYVSIGTFPLAAFQFDNIIENGGFEDETFPDFLSNGTLRRISKADDSKKVRTGDYALEMDNDNKVNLFDDNYVEQNVERARTRLIPVKSNKEYEINITRRRLNGNHAYRYMGLYYNSQKGAISGENALNPGIMVAGANDGFWQIHPQSFTTPAVDDDHQTVRFEFPTWDNGGRRSVQTSFDNFIFREKMPLAILPAIEVAHGFPAAVFPEGYVNIIKNGDFEDELLNNDGTPYTWTLASENANADANGPQRDNSVWNGKIRLQDQDKPDDQVGGDGGYAHSGTRSVRFSTEGNRGNNFDFTVTLEANKKYRFNFWHRNPHWNDYAWVKIRIGNNEIWGNELGGRNNYWANADLYFTTTETDNVLHLYTTSDLHGDWMNIFFDDFVLYEIPSEIQFDAQGSYPVDLALAGKTNLIKNGNFEDTTIDNEGNPYTWTLASDNSNDDANYPVKWNDQWGSVVKLQDQQKRSDTGLLWAHSGTHSLRFSFLDDWGAAQSFEGLENDILPDAYRANMNFKKELEPNKTYTFVFWLKTANYGDRGKFVVANGDFRIWDEELSTKYINWTRQQITFSTTAANHTLRMFTEFGGWFNFYLDDLFLYEEDTYVPYTPEGDSYLAFGQSTGTNSTDVEVEYIKVDNTGAFAPVAPIALLNTTPANAATAVAVDAAVSATFDRAVDFNGTPDLTLVTISPNVANFSASANGTTITFAHDAFANNTAYTVTVPKTAVSGLAENVSWNFTTVQAAGVDDALISGNLTVFSVDNLLTVKVEESSMIAIYNALGMIITNERIDSRKAFALPAGVYLIKSVSDSGKKDLLRAVNK